MRRLTSMLFALALLAGTARVAAAFPSWMQEGKAGIWMFNLKFGPSIQANAPGCPPGQICYRPTFGAIVPEIGVAVDHARNAYITLPVPEFLLHDTASYIIFPIGFQYDIPIHKVPGLYITPALSVGYALLVPNCFNCSDLNGAWIEPSVGAKFIFKKRWNVGAEPFSLPIIITRDDFGNTFTTVHYRLLFYGGVNF